MKLVLVVDGHSESRHRLQRLLTSGGHEVVVAENGQRALDLAPGVQPDLVLLAIVMPELNGFQTAAQLRTIPQYKSVPIVLLGGVPPLGINDEPLSSLVNGFLSLEAPQEELLDYVERVTT